MLTSCSLSVSPSLSARTVTVRAAFQLPLSPWVKARVFWSPAASGSASTATAEASDVATVITTSVPGSVSRTTV